MTSAADSMKLLRKKRQEKGLCTKCGKKKASPGYKTCSVCREDINTNRPRKNAIVRSLITWEVRNYKLYRFMLENNLTTSKIAASLDVNTRTVERWLFEDVNPRPLNLSKFIKLYKLNLFE